MILSKCQCGAWTMTHTGLNVSVVCRNIDCQHFILVSESFSKSFAVLLMLAKLAGPPKGSLSHALWWSHVCLKSANSNLLNLCTEIRSRIKTKSTHHYPGNRCSQWLLHFPAWLLTTSKPSAAFMWEFMYLLLSDFYFVHFTLWLRNFFWKLWCIEINKKK